MRVAQKENMECYRHPERDGTYFCQKDGNYMCKDCACCHSMKVYCQYRTACVINLLTKEGELLKCRENTLSGESLSHSEKSSVTG